MRCPDCNKFVGLENGDPEVDVDLGDLEYDGDVYRIGVTGTVRLVRQCAECSNELKEATFDVEEDVEIPKGHDGDGHDLTLEADEAEVTESGGGRYAKNNIGFALNWEIRCSCQKKEAEPLASGTVTNEMAASHFDELV